MTKKKTETTEAEKTAKKVEKTEDKKLRCVWSLGTECSDDVKMVPFFNSQIEVPVCSNHIEEHRYVMILHKNGYDIEEVLQETPEYRKGEVLVIQLSGIDQDKDVEL